MPDLFGADIPSATCYRCGAVLPADSFPRRGRQDRPELNVECRRCWCRRMQVYRLLRTSHGFAARCANRRVRQQDEDAPTLW